MSEHKYPAKIMEYRGNNVGRLLQHEIETKLFDLCYLLYFIMQKILTLPKGIK